MSIAQKRPAAGKRSPKNRAFEGHLLVKSKVVPRSYFRWKEVFERLLAVLLLVPGLPLIALLALIVRLHSRGPGIFRQTRLGKNARVFTMYKIRTMRVDAEKGRGAVWCKPHDPRITRLGRFLRKLHFDELPQLFNVVKGEMALVGPRPERPEIAFVLAAKIPGYTDRLVVLPGITGLAQINLPPDVTLDDVRRKLPLDMEYIEQAGPFLDTRIFLSTFVRLLGLPGVLAMRLLGLRRPVPRVDAGAAAGATPETGCRETAATMDDHPGDGKPNGQPQEMDRPAAQDSSVGDLPLRNSVDPHKPR